ncbi:MAG: HTH domain-containing protein [Candidatus Eisenbacteria bacterium]|nr:HTH domain-containing protein [Candidatus Eisenbacteria bacterium]
MPMSIANRRGRKPSIATAARHARDIRKTLTVLVREIGDLEDRLALLDRFHRSRERLLAAARRGAASPGVGMRGRGPNVRDVAHEILVRGGRPMNIATLASRVLKQKGGKAGANFTQNLGAALHRDRRFKRAGRGLYSAR